MSGPFKKIGLFAKHNSDIAAETFVKLIQFLKKRGHLLSIESRSAKLVPNHGCQENTYEHLGEDCDLVIVVGGDGSLLNAARAVVPHEVPMLGVNRGRLGFLTDILPDEIESRLNDILEGDFIRELRTLLTVRIKRENKIIAENNALNDIVLYSGNLARMFEFEISIDQKFVSRENSDGLITATPTGSTAYALSGGGPIMYPTLHAMVLVPMFPHTLSSRPLVVGDKSQVMLYITQNNDIFPKLSCDGQWHFDLKPGDQIEIQKHDKALVLIHPKDYDYFAVLREKLGWHTRQKGRTENNRNVDSKDKR